MVPQRVQSSLTSKEIKRIFQRVGEIIDENQKKNRAQNATLRNSSLDRNRGRENSIKGHTLAATGEEVCEP